MWPGATRHYAGLDTPRRDGHNVHETIGTPTVSAQIDNRPAYLHIVRCTHATLRRINEVRASNPQRGVHTSDNTYYYYIITVYYFLLLFKPAYFSRIIAG